LLQQLLCQKPKKLVYWFINFEDFWLSLPGRRDPILLNVAEDCWKGALGAIQI
jgi:hypothetical protein